LPFSTTTEYATRALLDLAMAPPGYPVKAADVARRQRIPRKYLEHVLLLCKKRGLVRSKPGLNGGYALARAAERITLAQVIRAVDGPIAPVRCVSLTAYAPCTCPNESACPIRDVWREARDAMVAVLERVTLADVARRARSHAELAGISQERPA
jgi:Rrf2 family protein